MNTTKHQHKYVFPPSLRPRSLLSNPIQFTISWVVVITSLPFVIPFLLSLQLYRFVVRLLARHHAGLLSPLTPYDCIFAVDSYHTRPYASNLTVLDLKSRVNVDVVRNLFRTRIMEDPCFSKLSCVPVEYHGYWFWKQLDNVDLNNAVRLYYDSELGEESKSVDECLREIIEMGFNNELFNVMVMHFGNKSVVVFRIHHTVCDGYSFNHLIDKFVGLESKYLVKEKKKVQDMSQSLVNLIVGACKWLILSIHLPLHIINLFRESVTHSPNFYTLRKSNTTGLIRRSIIPLKSMKQIRAHANSHFASVGMSLMTGALQKFYDESPRTSSSTSLRPKRLAIMHSLPKPNHPLTSLCNHWGVGLFKIPFVKDAVSRMYGAEEDFNEYTTLCYDTVLHIHIPIVGLVPTWIVKWFFSINFGTSCGFTSVPGLFDKLAYVGGNAGYYNNEDGLVSGNSSSGVEVAHMWKVFGLQWRQSAVAVAMYTYRGEASISFYANKDIIPDNASMDRLIELFHEEFNELLNYSTSPPPPPPVVENGYSVDKKMGKFIEACFDRDNKLA